MAASARTRGRVSRGRTGEILLTHSRAVAGRPRRPLRPLNDTTKRTNTQMYGC